MKPEEFIRSKLDKLNIKPEHKNLGNIGDEIFHTIMSKKFRKYSVTPEYQEHIRSAIKISIENNEPIKFVVAFGAYKLWRLDEAPEADWAELFCLIYYAEWLKKICEIYEPGVWFDFYTDDALAQIINNLEPKETEAYQKSFMQILDYLVKYLPPNLKFTFNRVIDQYENREAFEREMDEKIAELKQEIGSEFAELSDEERATVEMNVRPTEDQLLDPKWREKVKLIHDAYFKLSKKRPYYKVPEKILVLTKGQKGLNSIAVGTTKRSIAKFWCGIGVLEKDGEQLHDLILSPKQIAASKFEPVPVLIEGLTGKNFHCIKVIEKNQ